jgi:hypothetical protein
LIWATRLDSTATSSAGGDDCGQWVTALANQADDRRRELASARKPSARPRYTTRSHRPADEPGRRRTRLRECRFGTPRLLMQARCRTPWPRHSRSLRAGVIPSQRGIPTSAGSAVKCSACATAWSRSANGESDPGLTTITSRDQARDPRSAYGSRLRCADSADCDGDS